MRVGRGRVGRMRVRRGRVRRMRVGKGRVGKGNTVKGEHYEGGWLEREGWKWEDGCLEVRLGKERRVGGRRASGC